MEHKFSKIRTPHTAHRTPHTAAHESRPCRRKIYFSAAFLRPFLFLLFPALLLGCEPPGGSSDQGGGSSDQGIGGSNPNSGTEPALQPQLPLFMAIKSGSGGGTEPALQPEPPVTVTFDTRGGSPIPAVELKRGEKVSEPAEPSKAASFFVGWFPDPYYTKPFSFTSPITEDRTLFARWGDPANKVTVTFDAGQGASASTVDVEKGDRVAMPVFSRDGHRLDKWYSDDSFTTEFDISTQTIDANITLYAKWVQVFTVEFDSDGGTPVSPKVADSGANRADIEPEDPVKQGHTFFGWYTNQQFSTLFFDDTTITENTAVYAQFIPNSLRSIVLSKTLPPQSELATYDQDTAGILENLAGDTAKVLGIIYVTPDGGSTTKDGSSWENAYDAAELKTAIDDAGTAANEQKPYLVLLAEGSYAISETLSMKNHVAIIGGFKDNGRDGTTILDGGGSTQVFSNTGLDNTAVLSGVTISNGFTASFGAGMDNLNSSPTLSHVTFSGNAAEQYGGGMLNIDSSPTLTNVTFSGNTAKLYGGGMYNRNSSPTLNHVTFSKNTAKEGGGMINNKNSSPKLSDVTFSGNTAKLYGGGMYNDHSSPTLNHVTFSKNSAQTNGGGMLNYQSSPVLINVEFSGNTAEQYGGGMLNIDSSPTLNNDTFSLANVTFSENTARTGPDMHTERTGAATS